MEELSVYLALAAAGFAACGLGVHMLVLLRRPKKPSLAPKKGEPGYGVLYAFSTGLLPWKSRKVVLWGEAIFDWDCRMGGDAESGRTRAGRLLGHLARVVGLVLCAGLLPTFGVFGFHESESVASQLLFAVVHPSPDLGGRNQFR